MAELLVGELAVGSECGRLANCGGLEKRIKPAKALLADVCNPLVAGSIPRNPFDSARVVRTGLAVAKVVGVRCAAKVANGVVRSVSVFVIDPSACRDWAAHVNPSKAVKVVRATANAELHIPERLVQRATRLPNSGTLSAIRRSQPREDAGFRVVVNEFLEFILCDFHGIRTGYVGTQSC